MDISPNVFVTISVLLPMYIMLVRLKHANKRNILNSK